MVDRYITACSMSGDRPIMDCIFIGDSPIMVMMMSWCLTMHQPFWVISVIKVR